jgi:hypothetical protein
MASPAAGLVALWLVELVGDAADAAGRVADRPHVPADPAAAQ